jgi:hypothetical protein
LVLHLQLDAAVLRHAPLGDVQLRQDLDARCQRRLHLHGRLHDLAQHAVDAVADPDLLLERLDVDVGRAALHGVRQQPLISLTTGASSICACSAATLTSSSFSSSSSTSSSPSMARGAG